MKKEAFTLIELLIVVIVIGILATLALPQYTQMIEKARSTEGILMLGHVRTGQFLHYAQYGLFANTSDAPVQIDVGPTPGRVYSTSYTDRTNYLLKIKAKESLFKDFYVVAYPRTDTVDAKKYQGGFKAACRKAKDPCRDYVFGMDHDGNILGAADLKNDFPAEFSGGGVKDYKNQAGL